MCASLLSRAAPIWARQAYRPETIPASAESRCHWEALFSVSLPRRSSQRMRAVVKSPDQALVSVPRELVPAVRDLIAKHGK